MLFKRRPVSNAVPDGGRPRWARPTDSLEPSTPSFERSSVIRILELALTGAIHRRRRYRFRIRPNSISGRQSLTPAEPSYAAHSAYHVLRSVNNFDYAVALATADAAPASPVGWSQSNAVVLGHGNRVHYKNMADTEDVAQQLYKVTSSLGNWPSAVRRSSRTS